MWSWSAARPTPIGGSWARDTARPSRSTRGDEQRPARLVTQLRRGTGPLPSDQAFDLPPATGAGSWVAGAAPSLTTGWVGRLAREVCEVEAVVADEARALQAEPPVATQQLREARRRVPVKPHQPLAFPALDQDLVTLDGHEQFQPLYPFDRHAQRVVMAQVVEL